MLLDDQPFADPTSLFVQPDHYVTRLLHAGGVSLDRLGVGEGPLPEDAGPEAWRLLCANWHLFRGTPVRYWFDSELGEIFGVTERPSADNADALYDQIADQLAQPRPPPARAAAPVRHRGAGHHRRPGRRPGRARRRWPRTRRSRPGSCRPSGPTATSRPAQPGWADAVERLGEPRRTSTSATTPATSRRWRSAGGTSSTTARCRPTTATPTPVAEPLEPAEARRIYRAARWPAERQRGGGHRVPPPHDLRDGPDVVRRRAGHDPAPGRPAQPPPGRPRPGTAPDTGHDIPVAVEFTRALQPLLERFGTHPNLHLVLFTVDADVLRREIAPLAGFYPVGLRRGALVVPRQPGARSAASRSRSPRSPASPSCPASSTTPGRSARSRPGTTCPAGSTPASSPGWSPSTGSTRTKRWTRDHAWSPTSRAKVFKL